MVVKLGRWYLLRVYGNGIGNHHVIGITNRRGEIISLVEVNKISGIQGALLGTF